MLNGLTRIDWHRVRHAFGPADAVPHLVRWYALDLIDPSIPPADDVPAEIWSELADGPELQLFNLIFHQSGICEATSYVVPFLLELAGHPMVKQRDRVIDSVNDLIAAAIGRMAFAGYTADSAEYDMARRVVIAARQQLPVIWACMQDTDEAVRDAAYALFQQITDNDTESPIHLP
jgi:hypothetical protein